MESIKCVIFGSIGKVKGYDRAIKVIEKNPNIHLLIAGPLWSPLEQKTLDYLREKEKKLKNLKVEERELKENEFEKYTKKADIILLPYWDVVPASGIFSRLVMYLKPMVVWNTYFFKEIEKKYGACLTVSSIKQFETKILQVHKSKKLRERLKKGAKKLLKANSYENMARKHINLYKNL